ncbi:MAG: FMN-binding protein [Deltaproteobacteria bacterium]
MRFPFLNIFSLLFLINAGYPEVDFSPKQLFQEIKKISGNKNAFPLQIYDEKGLKTDTFLGRFYSFKNTNPIEFAYLGRVNTCRSGGCQARISELKTERAEFFDYFILFDSTTSILSVKIFNYEATHGQEITVKGWLKQFNGFHGESELIVGKDIDAISGATISVHSITNDVVEKTGLLQKYLSQKK